MEKILGNDANYFRELEHQKILNYMNNNEASTSKNIYSSHNQFEESNIEIITNCQSDFVQLSSIYNINEGTTNIFCENLIHRHLKKSNFFTLIPFFKYYFK